MTLEEALAERPELLAFREALDFLGITDEIPQVRVEMCQQSLMNDHRRKPPGGSGDESISNRHRLMVGVAALAFPYLMNR